MRTVRSPAAPGESAHDTHSTGGTTLASGYLPRDRTHSPFTLTDYGAIMSPINWSPEERAADARLHAAAPDLLAALKDAREALGRLELEASTADAEICLEAQGIISAAIAKAEGK